MTVAKPAEMVATLLRGQAVLATVTESRIFPDGLPETENEHMPRACISITLDGNPSKVDMGRAIGRTRLMLRCYGERMTDAEEVFWLARKAIKRQDLAAIEGALWFTSGVDLSGPFAGIDGTWPMVFGTVSVTHGEDRLG